MANTFIVRTSDTQFQTRASGSSHTDGVVLFGYGATFGDVTHIRSWEGEFDEQVAPGAFAESLSERTPIVQWNHGRDPAIGMVPIGVITTAREDSTGLFVEAELHDNALTLPVRQAIASGAVTGMSFKFEVLEDHWRDNTGKLLTPREVSDLLWSQGSRGPLVRTLTKVRLHETGPVSSPAYPSTSVGLRSTPTSSADIDRLDLLILKGKI